MTEKGRSTLTTRHTDGWGILTVEDNGPGVPAEIQSRILDPLFTTKEVGKGSGQGLAICRDVIVEKHQGQLTCSSKFGGGYIFAVRLPLLQIPE